MWNCYCISKFIADSQRGCRFEYKLILRLLITSTNIHFDKLRLLPVQLSRDSTVRGNCMDVVLLSTIYKSSHFVELRLTFHFESSVIQ